MEAVWMKIEEINKFSVDKGASSSLDLNQEMKFKSYGSSLD